MSPKHILLAVDLSSPNTPLFEYVAYQAKMSGAEVSIVNVLEPFRVPTELSRVIWNPERLQNMEDSYNAFAREKLEEIAKTHMHGQEVNVIPLISSKSAGEAIVTYAKEHQVDLIALSSHRRSSVGQFLLGSTVQKVLSLVSIPVIVIPG